MVFICLMILLLNLAIFYYAYFFEVNGYFPSPFFYDKSDTFMDLFNPIYWSCNGVAYKDMGAIYPPLPFLFLELIYLTIGYSDCLTSLSIRGFSGSIMGVLDAFYLFGCMAVFATKAWRDFTPALRVLIFIAALLSTPMLYAIERGNLILLTPFFLAIALSEKGYVQAAALAVLINLKPYFALLWLLYPLKKKLERGAAALLFSGLLFFITGFLFDDHFFMFFRNIFNFSQQSPFSGRELIGFPSSISAFSYFLKIPSVFDVVSKFFNSEVIKQAADLIEIVKWSSIFCAMIIIAKKSYFLTEAEVLVTLLVIISNLGIWVGGYTLVLYFTLIPILNMMRFRLVYFLILALIAMPLDLIVLSSANIGQQYSYLSDSIVDVHWTLGLGSFVRPVINLLLLNLLVYEFSNRKVIKADARNYINIRAS